MEDSIYHIKIKKDYASALIEDLLQVDAIEIVQGQIPNWQEEETLKRLEKMKTNPETVISEKNFFNILNKNA